MLFEFAEKTIAGIIFAVICVAIATFFGNPFFFDPVILVTFIAVALFFRRNRDLLLICLIFVAQRGMEELMWRTLQNDIWFKLPAYLIFMFVSFFFARGWLKWMTFSFFALTFGIEIYWQFYADWIPFILLTCYMMASTILVRYALVRRVFWQIKIFGKHGQFLPLDVTLLQGCTCFIVLDIAFISEFFLRELFSIKIMWVYSGFSFVSSVISLFIIYNIIIESLRYLRTIELPA